MGAQAELVGNARQSRYGAKFGETATPAYAIVNLSAQYAFRMAEASVSVRAGVENLLDRSYSTYSDWNKIPCQSVENDVLTMRTSSSFW